MRTSRKVLGLFVVAGLAYAAGHANLFPGAPGAWAGPDQENSAEMQAYIDAGTPGAHHKYLDTLVGEWDCTYKMYMEPGEEAIACDGTVTREWVLDGRYLRETVQATTPWGPFSGLGFIGYNNVDGQYEFIWMENMATAIHFETGSLNPETGILTTRGSHRDPVTGRVISAWGELDLSDSNRQTFVGYCAGPDGKPFKQFEGFTSRKDQP